MTQSIFNLVRLGSALFACAALVIASTQSQAVVLFKDGFGDADINNNGTPLEAADVDVGGGGLGTPGDSYVPVEDGNNPGTSLIFPAGTTVQELTTVEDPTDKGLPWYQARGFDPSMFDKPSMRIISDNANDLPETDATIGFTHPQQGQQFSAAIGTGNALAIEQKGRGSAFAAFFDNDYSDGNQGTISLGPEIGDQIKVSLDFRVWMSAANNNFSNSNMHIPQFSDIRIGLYQDTDSELGSLNNSAGLNDGPAVWGSEGGHFRGDNTGGATVPGPGASGDAGWYALFKLGDTDDFFLDAISPDGTAARVFEETNQGAGGQNFIEGNDSDSVIVPSAGTDTFVNLDYRKVYNLSLTLERFDDPNDDTAGVGVPDTIKAIIQAHDYATGTTYTLEDYEDVGVAGQNDLDGGIESDSWDYFGMKADGSTNEFDYLIDNFLVECFGSNCGIPGDADGDGDVDGSDFLYLQVNDPAGIPAWVTAYNGGPLSNVGSVPEPTSIISLFVGSLIAMGARRRIR